MNLYGDLPPPSSSTGDVTIVEESFFIPPPKLQPVAPTSGLSNGKPASVVAMKPSTLAFKPRQTKPHGANASSVILPIRSITSENGSLHNNDKNSINNNNINNKNVDNDNNLSSTGLMKTTSAQNDGMNKENSYKDDIDEFKNMNTSFEVSEQEAYDPRKPNDYIAYCEERLQQRKAAKLAEENRRLLEEQERAREELQRERREAVQRGDFDRLASGAVGRGIEGSALAVGRGRGRGSISNLPSWMTQNMTQAASGKEQGTK